MQNPNETNVLPPISESAIIGEEVANQNHLAATNTLPSLSNTEAESDLLEHITEYLSEAKLRFRHLLTGMATTTAEMIHHLEDAAVHIEDHIKSSSITDDHFKSYSTTEEK